jgi:two-component system sensor histidine kinase BaeS
MWRNSAIDTVREPATAALGDNGGSSRPRSAMSPGVTTKLFLAFLLTNVLTALVVAMGLRVAFNTGFERYVGEREAQRLTRLANELGEAYRERGGWDFLRGRDDLWVQLNHAIRPDLGGPAGPLRSPAQDGKGFQASAGPAPGDRPPPGIVLDGEGRIVVGDANPQQPLDRQPVMVEGRRVGWVAAPSNREMFDVVDRRFREELVEALWGVALLAIATAAIVAGTLAQGLLFPVKRLAGATRRMADGDYAVRVETTSRDELGQLVEDFNRLGNALERQESVRRNFMADISHELRTPIAVLRAELEALQDGVRPVTREALASLHAEIERLRMLVDDVHDLSLADVGGLSYRFETVDLGAAAREVLHNAAARLRSRGLAAELSEPPAPVLVRADERRLHQLLANLLENSLRYTHEGGRIRVTVADSGKRARVVWEDSPPGVPDDALPRLFERLYRVEGSRSRERGGSGLGLAICESIASAHGGGIGARHSELGGLAVVLDLPLEGAHAA